MASASSPKKASEATTTAAAPTSPRSPQSPASQTGGLEHLDTNEPIEADEDHSTSDYASGAQTDTTSVATSVRNYVYENGRRYHRYGGEGKYALPNDETEQDRLDLMHHVALMVLGGELHLSPVQNPQRVLDCGTGTGIWALDFGDLHPEAEVTGVDLSPIQPGWVAPNVQFQVDDLEKDWTWPENHFDFIHSRSICNGIRDYQKLVNQTFKHCTPGGYVELVELSFDIHARDGTMGPETAMGRYFNTFHDAMRKMGVPFPDPNMMKTCMENAGFEDITVKTVITPWGPWPKNKRLKEIGATVSLCGPEGFEAYALAPMTRTLGWDEIDAKKLCYDAYQDMLSRKVHAIQPVYHVYGRKPAAN